MSAEGSDGDDVREILLPSPQRVPEQVAYSRVPSWATRVPTPRAVARINPSNTPSNTVLRI